MNEQIITYEHLVSSYEDRLLNQLRGHGVDLEFLEMWVPDEDIVASILNMVEAAGSFGTEAFTLRISGQSLPPGKHAALAGALGPVSDVEITGEGEQSLVRIRNIRA